MTQSAEEMKFHWTSFVCPADLYAKFEYHGPWWVSGYDADDNQVIVAAVMATDEAAAYETLRLAFDEDARPESLNERFSGQKDWETPFSGRFPQDAWMRWPWPLKPLEPRP